MFGQWNAIQESLYKISRPKIHTAQVIDHDVKNPLLWENQQNCKAKAQWLL